MNPIPNMKARAVAGLAALLAAQACAAGLRPEEQGPLMDRLMAVQEIVIKRHKPEPGVELRAELRKFWGEVLEYTRTHSGRDLQEIAWGMPFEVAHEWLVHFGRLNYEESDAATREGLKALREAKAEDPRVAAQVAARVGLCHAYRWQKVHPVACARLAGQVGEWVESFKDPALSGVFFRNAACFYGNCLLDQVVIPEEAREEFARDTARLVWRHLNDERLSLRMRTVCLSHWADCLFKIGKTSEAWQALGEWWTRHGDRINEEAYCRVLMKVALLGMGNWDMAKMALEKAGRCRGHWKQSSEEVDYEKTCRLYYDNLRFPGYEVNRVGLLQQREWLKQWMASRGVTGRGMKLAPAGGAGR